ncbi:MAG: aminotransferase class III-fold pyridoxal phosphate-dependent enzyme, partial [Chloroflexi bacterium]|nr:aminotransferase class III-fold pyridoxal phosphate-dependent enzyme [Chloroflexota bacterium]
MTQGWSWIEKAASHLLPSGAPLDKFARGEIDPSSITDSGHGIYIRDITGKECISGASGAVNVNIGYSRKELAEAAYEQMIKLGNGGFTPGGSTAPIEYAYQLAKFTPYNLKRFMFVHSGSEANDSGYKIARFYWSGKGKEKKYKIISPELAYHGLTIGSLYATRSKAFWNKFGPPLPGYVSIPEVYCYHCPFKKTYPGCSLECAEALAATIEKEGADTVAAFVGEPIYGVAGTIMPPPEYWPRIREICTKYEVLLIDDEVMTGFGRTG